MKKEHKVAIAKTILQLYSEHHLGGIEASTRQYFWQYYTRALRLNLPWSFEEFYETLIPEQVRQTKEEKAAYHEKLHSQLLEQCYDIIASSYVSSYVDPESDDAALERLEQLERLDPAPLAKTTPEDD